MDKCCSRLHVLSFGLAVGVTWGIAVLLLGLAALFFSWGTQLVGSLGSLYLGYEPTFFGCFIGTVWAFADGFIGGVILAFFYNLFATKCCIHTTEKE